MIRGVLSFGVLALAGLVLMGALSAYTASNSVPPSRAGQFIADIGPNDLKPEACSGIHLTNVLVRIGPPPVINGSEGNTLILTSGVTRINARSGNDCIIAAGAVQIDGGPGTNVCIGGPGSTFTNCAITMIR